MKIIDFGKNTYQYEIDFRFDFISPEVVRRIVEDLHLSKGRFTAVSKDPSTNQTALTQGDGTPESPVYQLRIAPDKILIWAGWHVTYEKWQQWRTSLFTDLQRLINDVTTELVLGCTSQSIVIVPAEKLIRGDQIPEITPVRDFYARFVPEELLQRYNAHLAFGDEEGKENLVFFVGAGQTPEEGNITFNVRWNSFDRKLSLDDNLRAHAARSDTLFDLFNSRLLSLLIKI